MIQRSFIIALSLLLLLGPSAALGQLPVSPQTLGQPPPTRTRPKISRTKRRRGSWAGPHRCSPVV
jgi:hypothetical protein